ncbi:PilN domain-containing protein, partial [bacterium]|nr:PilN domain-containing protein [bacterium]
TSCCVFFLENGIIKDYTEEPLAAKSFTDIESYTNLAAIAEESINRNTPMSLLVISETDDVNAELLATRVNFHGEIDFFSKNISSNEEFIDYAGVGEDIDTSTISYITLEAVGAAVSSYIDSPVNINFLPPERINNNLIQVGDYDVDTKKFSVAFIVIALIIAGIITALTQFCLNMQLTKFNEDRDAANNEANNYRNQMTPNSDSKDNIFPILKQLDEQNIQVVNLFSALSTDIPDGIYIQKFVSNASGGVGIIGEAKSSDAVYQFVKKLKEKRDDIILSNLTTNSDLLDTSAGNSFIFQITTSSSEVDFSENNVVLNPIKSSGGNTEEGASESMNSRRNMLPPPAVI